MTPDEHDLEHGLEHGLEPTRADELDEDRTPTDPVGVLAVACGFVGIAVCGIVFAIITAILGGMTGQRAREAGRSLETAYLALLMAGVDGLVWIAVHIMFDLPLVVG